MVYGYSEQEAVEEAARCLDCHRYCSLCVGVCPNLALQTWRSEPFEVQLPSLDRDAGRITIGPGKTFRAAQAFQIAVLADFCNECGNCVTFCPTAGEPYRDKPRLYADRAEFEAQQDNAFTWWRDPDGTPVMEARWQGKTHRIELAERLQYRAPDFYACIDPAGFEVTSIEPTPGMTGSGKLTLQPCATMYVLLKGLAGSLPYLPAAAGEGKGRIPAPAYEEQE